MPGGGGGDMESEGYQLERRGIRLPNHKAVVSHIAVDVCAFSSPFCSLLRSFKVPGGWCVLC